ncbi:alkene reductase [Roseateles sp. BYS180W]|uniref:Alkene reductase n=1 Tax=Roseateles rivi TaxID=3299028 RepID=A0ABW7FU51_9BURK
MAHLFDPLTLGEIALPNRIVMAPLTRCRAPGQLATPLMAQYYAQRASAGLLISEGTQISPQGQGYVDTPGLYSAEQVTAWRQVTEAVHAQGGRIVAQLWHVGRISHTDFQPGGGAPISSTARAANGKTYTARGFEPLSAPRALSEAEIPEVIAQYVHAARCAMDAGFDGVEAHGANGYLIEQFLRASINDRQDGYGGSVAARCRFAVELMQALCTAIGHGRVGLRLSPVSSVNDAGADSDAQALYEHLADQLAPLRLAFVHLVEGVTGGPREASTAFDYQALRQRLGCPTIANNGYTRELAMNAVSEGRTDAVAFGRAFIANPDLVRRLRLNAALNAPDPKTFYGGAEAGYTDYPALDA